MKKERKKPVATTIKTPKKPKVKEPESPQFVNDSKEKAFAFAELRKKQMREAAAKQRAEEEKKAVTLTRRPKKRHGSTADEKFSKKDLDDFRRELMKLRDIATGKSSTFRNVALEQIDERGAEDEDGSDAFMRLQNLGHVDEQNKIIHEIDAALRRIDDGTYGICEICGLLIRKPRLLNTPFVHTCMECQLQQEKS